MLLSLHHHRLVGTLPALFLSRNRRAVTPELVGVYGLALSDALEWPLLDLQERRPGARVEGQVRFSISGQFLSAYGARG